MIQIRSADARGRTQMGWLDSYHTFSFGQYHDPRHMGFRHLRVINDDYIAAGGGFGMHPHRDMEIVTYVLEGELEHRDSLGSGSIIRPGDVQRMTAGTGILHSEFNPSQEKPVHLLQIWILPEQGGLKPTYEERRFDRDDLRGKLRVIAAHAGQDEGGVAIHQDVRIHASMLEPGDQITHELAANRHAWLQVAHGSIKLNGTPLKSGDGVAMSDEGTLRIGADETSEILLFDLA